MPSTRSSPLLGLVDGTIPSPSGGMVLYWDPSVATAETTYDRTLASPSPASEPEPARSNISRIVAAFDTVRTLQCVQTLMSHLFAYKESQFVTLFYQAPAATDPDQDSLIQFIATQFAHIPGLFVVLNDDHDSSAHYVRLGAYDVVPANLGPLAEWDHLVDRIRRDYNNLIGSPTRHLKAVLALQPESSPNILSRFTFSSKHVLEDFRISLDSIVSPSRADHIKSLIGSWDFYAHDLSYDELLAASYYMILHALQTRGLEQYHIPESRLISMLLIVRNCYHAKNPYHNFRHAVDVVQATFYFLLELGVFNPFNDVHSSSPSPPLSPEEGLSVLVAALGHDVGHPGVTNAFLVTSNAPLAKIYNGHSVLESYHSAAFNQILKEYWPQVIANDAIKEMVTQTVLATDMAVHFDFMKRATDPKIDKSLPSYHTLLGCLLLKCADISNVSRRLDISSQWGRMLVDEFGGLAALEVEMGFKKPPSPQAPAFDGGKGLELKLLRDGQIFFIKTYGLPLFEAVTKLLPPMLFATKQIRINMAEWDKCS